MATFFYPITVSGPSGRSITLDALVDTGASFTSLPRDTLTELGIKPFRQARLRLADGPRRVQGLGEAQAEIDDLTATTIVVFGEQGSPPVIGAYTLEGLMLGVDPVEHRLVPVEGWGARFANAAAALRLNAAEPSSIRSTNSLG